eukprot:CAMPEP_0175166662 /NCGR_PEP_ID=MMETSP0087-20121206/27840_1 /TAXON_ID=136419 /ORGANISM="Unknown Unknown, Strain D1" /LENGTH=53 /DNA_ID=CAMNT_0016456323 /DNA_START=298 /DNA_END=456 /DNA_ORIENTATION=+
MQHGGQPERDQPKPQKKHTETRSTHSGLEQERHQNPNENTNECGKYHLANGLE